MRKQIKDFRGYKVMSAQVPVSHFKEQGLAVPQGLVVSQQQVTLPLEQIRIIQINVRIGRITVRD